MLKVSDVFQPHNQKMMDEVEEKRNEYEVQDEIARGEKVKQRRNWFLENDAGNEGR